MLGGEPVRFRSPREAFPARQRVGPEAPVVLSVRGLTAPGVSGVSFDLHAGEIVGLAGLVGAGRTELARAVYQAHRTAAGTVSLAGGERLTRRHRPDGPRAALRAGVAMIPESRKEDGLLPRRSVRENVSLASPGRLSRAGIVRRRPERRTVEQILRRGDVRAHSQAMPADALSGGNQQKLLFARMLLSSGLRAALRRVHCRYRSASGAPKRSLVCRR